LGKVRPLVEGRAGQPGAQSMSMEFDKKPMLRRDFGGSTHNIECVGSANGTRRSDFGLEIHVSKLPRANQV